MRFFNLDRLRRIGDDVERGWPGYLLGGRVRTSTVVLIVAFAALWWIYDDQRDSTRSTPTQVPATEVVPPGFVPDPSYTWVPRSRVQEPPTTVTVTPTPTTTPPQRLPPPHRRRCSPADDRSAPAVRAARHHDDGAAAARPAADTPAPSATARLTLMARLANVSETRRYTGGP